MSTQRVTRTRRQSENQCAIFNKLYPLGQRVKVRLDSGEERETTTRSEAYVCEAGYAVIFMNGIRGYYLLDRVTPCA